MIDKIKNQKIVIRMADLCDAQQILQIYVPYVQNSSITFEYEPPDVAEFSKRMAGILEKYPYLVAEEDGKILGYCYVSQFKNRDAYDWAVETTIYICPDCKGRGLGRKLYEKLEEILRAQNILNLNACIAYPHPESITFHEKMGYEIVAHFHKCGYKQGIWYDMIWMEKMLGDHEKNPLPVISVKDIDIKRILRNS